MKKTALVISIVLIMGLAWYVSPLLFDKSEKQRKEELSILAFGDSLTYGEGDREEEGYVGKLERRLATNNGEQKISVVNYGVPGRQSKGILKELTELKTADKLNEADLFIVFIGTNDLLKSNGGDYSPLQHDKIMQGKQEYLNNTQAILKILQTANENAPIYFVGIYNPYPNGEKIEKYIDDWNRSSEKMIKEHENVQFVQTNDLFKGKDKDTYFSDSLHLNNKGYSLLANRIYESISKDAVIGKP